MIGKESIKYSLNNIKHKKTRSFLTILSILVGIATIFIFISFGWGLYDYIDSFTSSTSADKVTVQLKGVSAPGLDDFFVLTEDDLDAVKKTAGVYDAIGVYSGVAEVEKNDMKKYVFYMGMDPKNTIMTELSGLKIDKGRELQSSDVKKAVLGYNYQLDNKIFADGLDVNSKILVQGVEFRVVGFYQSIGNPQDDSNVYITENAINEIFPNTTGYAMLVAKVDIENMDQIIVSIENNVRKSRGLEKGKEDFYVASFQDLIESYTGALDIVIGFVILIALISVLVSAVNTANTMITSVLERYNEIGIIKSIGAKNSEVLSIFLFESSFLGFVAGIVGVFFGWVLTYLAGTILDNLGWGFLSPHYSLTLFAGCVIFATVTGAISGVVPAIKASKTNVVDALRYE